ncbi:superoxide dismutase family protein [bacterium]|nr:superoxide dismutase family protein [bacterium]
MAGVAVFQGAGDVSGSVLFEEQAGGVRVLVDLVVPPGAHGFHIHRAGDLRGVGCAGACDHWSLPRDGTQHGGPPGSGSRRHTGDLGNIVGPRVRRRYWLAGVRARDLWGRTVIVHADPDDLGRGGHPDSLTTGHSGARIGCAVIGRTTARRRTQKRL